MSEKDFIHNFIPAQNPAEANTILLLHGTGGNESDLIPMGKILGDRHNLLGIRGKVLENGMSRYFRRLAEGIFDLEDLQFRTKELFDFLQYISGFYKIDSSKIIALAYSNGANIAGSILLTYPDFLKGFIQFRPMIPFEAENLKIPETPVLITAGKYDPLASVAHVNHWAEILRKAGAKTDLHFTEAGHNLIKEDIDLAKKWFEENFLEG